ncbi:MAG: NosD domain-containing protein [Thermoplasmatota archaeon]
MNIKSGKKSSTFLIVTLLIFSSFTVIIYNKTNSNLSKSEIEVKTQDKDDSGTVYSEKVNLEGCSDDQKEIGIKSASYNYQDHEPIRIDNNSDLAAQAIEEGWSGDGSQDNPYVIEGYKIDGSSYGYGIYIGNTTDHFIVKNCYMYNASGSYGRYWDNTGLLMYNASNGIVKNNTSTNNSYGIRLYSSSSNILSNNTLLNDKYGIYLYSTKNNILSNNSVSKNTWGIHFSYSNHNVLANNTVSSNMWSICLRHSSNNTLKSNDASNNDKGIQVYYSRNNTFINNVLSSNKEGGIKFKSSNFNTLINNIVSSNYDFGISLKGSNSYILNNNTVSNNGKGFYLESSSKNVLINNSISNNSNGIYLHSSTSNTLSNNTMKNNGIYIYGSDVSDWNTHKIDTLNTVNEKPVYYWKNRNEGRIPQNAGQVILANCTNITIKGLEVSGGIGIDLGFSEHNIITNNKALKNSYGIRLKNSNKNKLSKNEVFSSYYGIRLSDSSKNILINNTISNNSNAIYILASNNNILTGNKALENGDGITLSSSINNTVCNNTISLNGGRGICLYSSNSNILLNNLVSSNNEYGMYLRWSEGNNIIYHNNFINNKNQAFNSGNKDIWYNSTIKQGNYWSDYDGEDSDDDGIGNIPYKNIDGDAGSEDKYPLMKLWGINDTSPPEADAGKNKTVKVNEEVNFDASKSSDNLGIISYEWRLDDGETKSGEKISYIYHEPGTYTVELIISDVAGNTDTDTITVTVEKAKEEDGDGGNGIPGFTWCLLSIGILIVVLIYSKKEG